MPAFLESFGRILRKSMSAPELPSEEDYLADASDRIDLELRMREYSRQLSEGRGWLGGAVR